MIKRVLLFFLVIILFCSIFVAAHEGEEEEGAFTAEKTGFDFFSPVSYIIFSGAWLIIVTAFILTIGKSLSEENKKLFFLLMVLPVGISSLYLSGFTIYENFASITGGPVHWHADYEIYICGEKLNLVDPRGISNKIGSSEFHEHNDDRIHIEGTVKNLQDVDLGSYFSVIGGELDDDEGHLVFNDEHKGSISVENGDICEDTAEVGELKVYVNGKKIEDYSDYLIYPDAYVPPGDCIIIAFDSSDSEKTDLICESWQIQGWNYDNFKRREAKISDRVWR